MSGDDINEIQAKAMAEARDEAQRIYQLHNILSYNLLKFVFTSGRECRAISAPARRRESPAQTPSLRVSDGFYSSSTVNGLQ